MRLYAKLTLFVALFLCLAWLSGEAGREQAWEVSLGARAYFAHLLGDQQLEDQLIAEAQVRRYGSWMAKLLAQESPPAAKQLRPGDFGRDHAPGRAQSDNYSSPKRDTENAPASF